MKRLLLSLVLILAACGGGDPEPQPQPYNELDDRRPTEKFNDHVVPRPVNVIL